MAEAKTKAEAETVAEAKAVSKAVAKAVAILIIRDRLVFIGWYGIKVTLNR